MKPVVVWEPQLDDSGSDAQPNPLVMFTALGANGLKVQSKHSGRASTQVCVFRAAPCWLAAAIMHQRLGPAVGSSRIQTKPELKRALGSAFVNQPAPLINPPAGWNLEVRDLIP